MKKGYLARWEGFGVTLAAPIMRGPDNNGRPEFPEDCSTAYVSGATRALAFEQSLLLILTKLATPLSASIFSPIPMTDKAQKPPLASARA